MYVSGDCFFYMFFDDNMLLPIGRVLKWCMKIKYFQEKKVAESERSIENQFVFTGGQRLSLLNLFFRQYIIYFILERLVPFCFGFYLFNSCFALFWLVSDIKGLRISHLLSGCWFYFYFKEELFVDVDTSWSRRCFWRPPLSWDLSHRLPSCGAARSKLCLFWLYLVVAPVWVEICLVRTIFWIILC